MIKKVAIGAVFMGILACGTVGFAEGTLCNCYTNVAKNQAYQQDNCLQGEANRMEAKNTFVTKGEIIAISDEGLVTVKGEGDYELIALHINKTSKNITNCLDAKATQIYNSNGKKINSQKLKVGMKVDCYYDTRVSRSYPGQANAKAIIVKDKDSKVRISMFSVSKVTEEKDFVTVETTNDELIASIGGKAYKYYNQIVEGDDVLIWYEFMTMSLPPRTNAIKAVVL